MKPIAWVVTISILLGTSGPTDSHVAQQPSQWHSAMGAMVMSRGELDTSKIVKGWHAHVVYLSEGVKGVTTGVIVEKDPDGITIEFKLHGIRPYVSARKEKDPDIITTKPGPWKRLGIAYDDIDTLVIAENRPTLKRWQKARQAIEKVVVMSRGDLDVSRLATGWYAHVVYTSEGIEGAATGEIIDKDADRIVIEYRPRASRYGRAKWKRLEIAFDDIDAIAVAQDRGDVEVWRKVRQAVQTRRETTKAPSCEIGANLLSVYFGKGPPDEFERWIHVGGGSWLHRSPGFYMSFFFWDGFAFDFALSFTSRSLEEDYDFIRFAQCGLTYLFLGPDSNSPYFRSFAANIDLDGSISQYGIGAGAGYRHVLRNGIALRFEAHYVRGSWKGWDEHNHRIELLLNVGFVLGRKKPFPKNE